MKQKMEYVRCANARPRMKQRHRYRQGKHGKSGGLLKQLTRVRSRLYLQSRPGRHREVCVAPVASWMVTKAVPMESTLDQTAKVPVCDQREHVVDSLRGLTNG